MSANGVPVPLGTTDFRLLNVLIERAGTTVTKDDLLQLVWGGAAVSDNVLYVHINALRKTLGKNCIVNKQGHGYRFVAPRRPGERRSPRPNLHIRSGNLPSLWNDQTATGPTRLIGRSEQLHTVSELLARGRLVTLTGPGGVGKTRLALQAAGEASSHFGDGVWLVELATLNEPDLVPSAIASVLSIKQGTKASPIDALSRYVAKKSLLLVLDNCEHLLAATARVLEKLLSTAPGVKLLATSREPLSCFGEQIVDVPPLALPEAVMSPDVMRTVPAVDLFIERAVEADARFRVSDNELAIVTTICRRVDGLPLAIEMVASWAGRLGLEALDAKLDSSLNAWLRARSTAPPRHSTLRATLEWSHGLLSTAEQVVLRRLAAFASSFSIEGAEAVIGEDTIPQEHVFEHIGQLIRKSMIAIVPGSGSPRFRLLETTQAFMLDELARWGDGNATRQRHAEHVLRILDRAMLELETTSDIVWLERYSPILDDLRAALDWAMGEESDISVALAGTSWPLWEQMSLRTEGRRRLGAAATRLRADTPQALQARLRRGLGEMLLNTAAIEGAYEEIERAVVLYRALDDRPNLGAALAVLGYLLLMLDRNDESERTIVEALTLLDPAAWMRSRAEAYSFKLCIDASLGRFEDARLAGEKAALLCAVSGNDRTAVVVMTNLVQLHLESGDVDGAILAGRRATTRLRDTRHSEIRAFALGLLSAALIARGDLVEALNAAGEAVPLLRDDGAIFWLFDHLALRAALDRREKDAALIAGYADAAYRQIARQRERMGRNAVERLQAVLQDSLTPDEIARLADLGAQLTEDQAIGLALSA